MPRLLASALVALTPLCVAVAGLAVPPRAVAQAPERPLVLVVDPGRARVSSDRLVRVIAAATARDVVRITDERARDPAGTLTIAYDGQGAWLVRFESGGRTAITHERVRRPGALDASLSAAAVRLIGEVEAAGREPAQQAAPVVPADEGSLYVTWADEILDPFASLPPPAPREAVIYSEVLDPFAPPRARRVGVPEVLDPWDH